MKEKYAHLALLGIGAAVVLWYLLRQSTAASASPAAAVPDNSSAAPSYPNSQPINLGDLNVGASPLSIVYNQSPTVPTVNLAPLDNDGCCDDENCTQLTALQTVQTVPDAVFQSSLSNLKAYTAKGPQVIKVTQNPTQQSIIDRDQEFGAAS